MTDRDRLIELFQEMDKDFGITCPNINTDKSCKGCRYQMSGAFIDCNILERKVDYLLANGVIVPPCKVGDIVWHKEEKYLLDSYCVETISVSKNGIRIYAHNVSRDIAFDVADFGKTVFLTKEGAEAKLKELKDNAT